MRPINRFPAHLTALFIGLLGPGQMHAQVSSPDLSSQIAALDSLTFAAFNAHDLDHLMSFFSEDLEFYHDQNGLQRFEDVAAGFEGLFKQRNGMRRELLRGSLRVYPIPGYGAIQVGVHEFCHMENGVEECGTFGFTHVWRRIGEGWKLTRVLSYGH